VLHLLAAALLAFPMPFSKKPRTNEVPVREIVPRADPYGVVIHDGKLYASGFRTGRISASDLLTGKKLGETLLDGYERFSEEEVGGKKVVVRSINKCCGGNIVHARGRLFAKQVFSDTLLVIDPESMRVIKRLPDCGSGALAVTPDGKTVVVAQNDKDEFHLIDAETYKRTTVPYYKGSKGTSAAAVSPDGRFLVLGHSRGGQPPGAKQEIENGNGFLTVYDLTEKKHVATVYLASSDTDSVSESAARLLFSPDGRTLYAGMFQATTGVRVIDTEKWKIVGDIRFAPNAWNEYFEWVNPFGLAFHRGWLYVGNRENEEVVIVDPKTREPVARLRFADPGHAFHKILTEGDRVYLVDQSAVYELDGWALTRRLNAWAETPGRAPLRLTLTIRKE
jgi:outer membrane protein assembly factor BamB